MEDIKAKIIFTDEGASAALTKVAGAAKENEKATKAAGDAAKKAGDSTKDATPKYSQFGSTVGLVGQSIGRLNPALGQTITTGAAALGSIQALTTAGMGPLGIAIGVISVAITAGTSLWASYGEAQDVAAEGTHRLTLELEDAAKGFDRISAARATDAAEASRGAALALGRATSAQYSIEETRIQRQLDALYLVNFQGEEDRTISRLEARLQQIQEMAATVTDTTGEAANKAFQRNKFGARETPARHGGGSADSAAARAAREAEQQTSEDARAREAAAAEQLARLTEDMDAEADVRRSMRALDIQEQNDAKDRAIEIAQEQRDAIIEAKRQEAEEITAIQQGVTDGFSLMNDVIKLAAGTSEAAQKKAAQVMAASAMVEAVVQGALEVARAAASYPDVAGMVSHGMAAAAFAVAATKAGIAAGGGGASAGGGSAPSARTGAPSLSGGSSERGGDTIVINWGSQGLVYAADRAQLGRDLEDIIGAGRSRLGRAA